MDTVSYTHLRNNLKSVLDEIYSNHQSVIVTRKNGENMVILSQEDFDSMKETAYLLQSPKNAQRLNEALNNSSSGNVKKHDIDLR